MQNFAFSKKEIKILKLLIWFIPHYWGICSYDWPGKRGNFDKNWPNAWSLGYFIQVTTTIKQQLPAHDKNHMQKKAICFSVVAHKKLPGKLHNTGQKKIVDSP